MLSQSFTFKNLKLLSGKPLLKRNFIRQNHDKALETCISVIDGKFSNDNFNFDEFNLSYLDGKQILECSSVADEIVLKKLNDNIKRLFKIHASDRHSIVKQTVSLLSDAQPFSIIRLDFEDFYGKSNRAKVISYIGGERLLSYQNKIVLDSFDNKIESIGITGLPRGISLSSTLSEISLRRFDKEIRKIEGVYFYARYVDDIIIFCYSNADKLLKEIDEVRGLVVPELKFNEKTTVVNLDSVANDYSEFDFLGYQIKIKIATSVNLQREIKVYVSDKKIKKIKNRIQKSFRSYYRKKDFGLLRARLKFLAGNQYVIGDIERTKLKSGIYYNYPLITSVDQLIELDCYYQKLLRTNYPPIRKPIRRLSKSEFEAIKKISFRYGFEKRLMNSYRIDMRKRIRGCW